MQMTSPTALNLDNTDDITLRNGDTNIRYARSSKTDANLLAYNGVYLCYGASRCDDRVCTRVAFPEDIRR